MARWFQVLVITVLWCKTAYAHPHDDVVQQALLSIGMDKVILSVRIVPSHDEGAAIYAHIDTNKDGVVSTNESNAFAMAVFSKMKLSIDGKPSALKVKSTDVPNYGYVAAGLGVIEIKGNAKIAMAADKKHKLIFETHYEMFTQEWLIQPFFYANLNNSFSGKEIQRSETGKYVEVMFTP